MVILFLSISTHDKVKCHIKESIQFSWSYFHHLVHIYDHFIGKLAWNTQERKSWHLKWSTWYQFSIKNYSTASDYVLAMLLISRFLLNLVCRKWLVNHNSLPIAMTLWLAPTRQSFSSDFSPICALLQITHPVNDALESKTKFIDVTDITVLPKLASKLEVKLIPACPLGRDQM